MEIPEADLARAREYGRMHGNELKERQRVAREGPFFSDLPQKAWDDIEWYPWDLYDRFLAHYPKLKELLGKANPFMVPAQYTADRQAMEGRAWKAEIEATFKHWGPPCQLYHPAGFARGMIPQAKFLLNTEGNKPPPLLAYAREDIEVARRLAAKDAVDAAAQSKDQAAAPAADPRWFTGDEPASAPPGAD